MTVNGKEASFLAGGEYPYPVVQSGQSGNSISIVFKEYGIRLYFTPTVLGGDLINLKTKPEVSSLDFNNAIVLDGFRLPALTTRRVDTEVALQDGQTFALAGLMNNTLNSTLQKIPGIGDIPVLGYLFKSRAYQKNETSWRHRGAEIVRRGSTGVSSGLPALVEPYLPRPEKTLPPPTLRKCRAIRPRAAPKGSQPPAPAPEPQPQAQQESAPVARPIQGSAALPAAPMLAPVPSKLPQPAAKAPAPKPMTKAEVKAQQKQHEKDAEAQKVAEKKAEEDKRAADKLEKERAAHEAEVAKKHAEIAKKRAEEDAKRDRRWLTRGVSSRPGRPTGLRWKTKVKK